GLVLKRWGNFSSYEDRPGQIRRLWAKEKPNFSISFSAFSADQPCSAIRKEAIIIPVRSSPMRQCTKIFLPGFLRSKVRNCANVLSFGNGHRQGSGTYCMPRRVTILRSLSREPRRSTTMLIPIFARVRKPSLEGWPPRYRVVVASPKFGRFLRIDLFWL